MKILKYVALLTIQGSMIFVSHAFIHDNFLNLRMELNKEINWVTHHANLNHDCIEAQLTIIESNIRNLPKTKTVSGNQNLPWKLK